MFPFSMDIFARLERDIGMNIIKQLHVEDELRGYIIPKKTSNHIVKIPLCEPQRSYDTVIIERIIGSGFVIGIYLNGKKVASAGEKGTLIHDMSTVISTLLDIHVRCVENGHDICIMSESVFISPVIPYEKCKLRGSPPRSKLRGSPPRSKLRGSPPRSKLSVPLRDDITYTEREIELGWG